VRNKQLTSGNLHRLPVICILVLAFLLSLTTSCQGPAPVTTRPTQVSPRIATAAGGPAGLSAAPTLRPDVALTAPATQPPATLIPSPAATAAPTLEPTATAALDPTPSPYADLTIAALANRSYGGGELQIVDTLLETDTFTRYLITYPSDGLTIYGYLNVPNEGDKFPVALVLHGYINPDAYSTVAYTERYATSLVEAGYMVIHPNFRNHPPSDSGPDPYRIGYAIDVLNLIAIIREQSEDPFGYLRRADADRIHLWGHSMGGGVALRVIAVNNAEYIRAAVLYGSMSGNEIWNYEQIRIWSNNQRGEFELAASPEMQEAISPIYHLARIRAAVSIHHSYDDQQVPVSWSEDLCRQLEELDHPVECFFYEGLPHTFNGWGDNRFMERVIDFFGRH
jgi:uncharacterized protein